MPVHRLERGKDANVKMFRVISVPLRCFLLETRLFNPLRDAAVFMSRIQLKFTRYTRVAFDLARMKGFFFFLVSFEFKNKKK